VIRDCHLFCKTGSIADLKHKEKEQRGRFGEIDEKISREEYPLDWSQSKVFLVIAIKMHKTLHFLLASKIFSGEGAYQIPALPLPHT